MNMDCNYIYGSNDLRNGIFKLKGFWRHKRGIPQEQVFRVIDVSMTDEWIQHDTISVSFDYQI